MKLFHWLMLFISFTPNFRNKTKKKKSVSAASQDDSRSKNPVKKPVYRLAKSQASKTKPQSKGDGSPKSKHVQDSQGDCLKKEEHTVPERPSLHESNNVENRLSKPLNSSIRVEERSEGSQSKKSSHGNSPSSMGQGSTATVVSYPQKKWSASKRKFAAEKTVGEQKDSNTRQSCETSSSSKHLLKQKEKELVEKLHPRLENTEFAAKKRFVQDEKKSSNGSNSDGKNSKNVQSAPDRTNDSTSRSSTSPLPPNYKIPKIVRSNPVVCNKNGTTEHLNQRNKPLNLEASVSSSVTLKEAHRCPDAVQSHISDRTQRETSVSDQLPSASHSATELWCDEVSTN